MDLVQVGQLVGSLGFPIVACGALFWLINKNEASRREDNAKFTEAINNNTLVITRVLDKICDKVNDKSGE